MVGSRRQRRNQAVPTGKALVGGDRTPYHSETECSKKYPIEKPGPHNPNKPTFMATKATREDLNAARTRDIECNVAALDHTFAMMATSTLPLRDAWIVDSGCAQHVCNNASRFICMDKYDGPPLQSVDGSTSASGGAAIDLSSRGASIRKKTNRKISYTASQYHGVYALDLWTYLSFPAYHVSPQMKLWHNHFAHLSDGNLRRLKQQAQGRMTEKPHHHPGRKGEYLMELLHKDLAGPSRKVSTVADTGSPSSMTTQAGSR
ncbi:hypothetical protein PSPO01_15964 [Paraphaeosphaeria sporulosa]